MINKELREDLEHLIICEDKSITQDLRDDIKMTLDYIDELENNIDKAIEYVETENSIDNEIEYTTRLLDILRGKDNG